MAINETTDILVKLPFRRLGNLHVDIERTININQEIMINIMEPLDAGKDVTGSFTTVDSKTITVIDGIITAID